MRVRANRSNSTWEPGYDLGLAMLSARKIRAHLTGEYERARRAGDLATCLKIAGPLSAACKAITAITTAAARRGTVPVRIERNVTPTLATTLATTTQLAPVPEQSAA